MGRKQTLILLKIQVEMVEDYTFKAKLTFLASFRKMLSSGDTKRCVDLN